MKDVPSEGCVKRVPSEECVQGVPDGRYVTCDGGFRDGCVKGVPVER